MNEIDLGLQAKLGSIIVHAEEALSPTAHRFDINSFQSLIRDPEVQAWLDNLRRLFLLPVKR